MFSFRRKSSFKPPAEPRIRGSPSLPELNNTGIPWPESLIDVSSIRSNEPVPLPNQGATRTSLPGTDRAPIPFHKPFRTNSGKASDGGPISSLYMANPNNAEDTAHVPKANGRFSTQRRARVPPSFNLMVAGGQGTGKTSLLRLLLETADLSPTASPDQRAALDRFLRGNPKTTTAISTACVEICESRFDRLLFSVIDTPGLDFIEGRELKLDRQVSAIVKYVDAQYADTMSEESKVIRQNKGDQHIHLCIYLIDPSSIMTTAARRAQSSLPTKTRSEATVSQTPPDLVPDTSSADDSDDEDEGKLTMSPAELRVIKRLSNRINVLPIIARSDLLTDERLTAVKEAVRNGLQEAGLNFGVFAPFSVKQPAKDEQTTPKRRTKFAPQPSENGHNTSEAQENGANGSAGVASDEDDERQSRPVIKLRPRHRALSRSRSRRDLSAAADDARRPVSPDATDNESIANVRFSAHIVAQVDLGGSLPFAIITPETLRRRHPRYQSSDDAVLSTAPASPIQQSEDGHAPPSIAASNADAPPETPVSVMNGKNLAYLSGPPSDLRGVFVRKFRWGTVDVLDPDHCDFAALRTAVFSTHLKVLKTHTKEVLYEKYRTEKLLARRATRQITADETQRLFEDLGL